MSGTSSLRRDFLRSPRAIISAIGAILLIGAAFLAPLIAPHSPFELGTFSLMDSELPPAFMDGGDPRFLLGTDMRRRDVFSAILFGMRISLTVGIAAVAISASIGTLVGLFAGFYGGMLDSALMRLADVILSFPTILIALLVAGIARSVAPQVAGGQGRSSS